MLMLIKLHSKSYGSYIVISIHLMLMLIAKPLDFSEVITTISIHLMLMLIDNEHSDIINGELNFNTSHVNVNQ